MTYDTWKATEPDDEFPKPSKEFLRIEIAEIEKEIAWNENRLINLVFNDEDRQQTADYIADLRQERRRLLGAMEND
jgi:hypothetical protein